jgi:hypothetical protein
MYTPFLMKAFWAVDTSSLMCGANRFASSLVIIFATLLIKLIGLYSDIVAAT